MQDVVAVREWVAGHEPVDGQRRDAYADAERDGADHESREHGVAAQALEGEAEVVGEHVGERSDS